MEIKKIVDFSQHTHTVEIYKCGDKEIRVDKLQKGNSMMGYVEFVNTDKGMSVYGDYSEWIFMRPFIPSPNGYADTGYYWRTKLANYSKLKSFDGGKRCEEFIQEMKDNWSDYVGEDDKEVYIEMLSDVDCYDEWNYITQLREVFDRFDICYENFRVPSDLDVHFYIVGEAFDEICKRLKNKHDL